MELVLERRHQVDASPVLEEGGVTVIMTPPIGDEYWAYRVRLTDTQAVVGFPKFGTVGIGYENEGDDWNLNFPYRAPVRDIRHHIRRNKGDDDIPDEQVLAAIQMIQAAVRHDRGDTRPDLNPMYTEAEYAGLDDEGEEG